MEENIIISNPGNLEKAKKAIIEAGVAKLHVLADFDRTLSTAFVNGKSIPSLISILRDENYLVPGYAQKGKELYAKYKPIEIDPNIPLKEKKEAMREWWTRHFALLIKSGLNKKDLESIVKAEKVKLRQGFEEFSSFLEEKGIPLVIMSSSGLGGDVISMFLKREGKLYDNMHIISNSYEWDEKGNAVSVKEPIIHGMNKAETAIQGFPVFEVIKDRKNVLLLGDSLNDIGMVEGFEYDNLIKIGFLNEKIEESLELFKKNYDVLILNDGSLEFVNSLLEEMIQ